jgi:AsmA-like C-terminal region
MPDPAQPGFWPRARIHFRRFRRAVLLLVAALIFVLLYLNTFGLPAFIKRPLLENLRERGLQVEFKDLRLSLARGLVAYDVRFGQTGNPAAPQISAGRVELALNGGQLRHLKFQIGGLIIYDARLAWPLGGTNELALEKIHAELRFLPGDQWQVDNLQLKLANARIRIGGTLTNASAIAGWKLLQGGPATNATPASLPPGLQDFADGLARLPFAHPPALRVNFSGDALHPDSLSLTLRARLDDDGLTLHAAIDPASRELRFGGASDFDLQKILPLLPEKAAAWLGQFSWEQPPQVRVAGLLRLPAGHPPDWSERLAQSLVLDGEFRVAHAAFRGIPALAAQSHFAFSNHVWRLPDLRVTRPEGVMTAGHWTDERTQDYYWHLRGTFDPQIVRPVLGDAARHALDLVRFTVPPVVDAELWGRWRDHDHFGVRADVAVSNAFTFRGETASRLRTQVEYTNLWLRLTNPRIERAGGQYGQLSSVEVDFARHLLYLTNGQCRLEPQVVARAIGTKTAHIMEAYDFADPPAARVEGRVAIDNSRAADLHFDIEAGRFHWWKFNTPRIAGSVIWQDETLVVTNVQADFYNGRLAGWLNLNFHPDIGNDFSFDLTAENTCLGPLMADLSHTTNQLEGVLSGRLNVTHANSEMPGSWQGGGNLRLHDSLLWEIPVFGVFAPVLNAVYPNLGSGRASSGSASFTITNSVVRSEDLLLNSPAMRLDYRGTVDFDGRLNARVEAGLLRDTWGIGPLVSTALWPLTKILEYKVTGDLASPKVEPLYLPKALLIPFHPIESFKELLPGRTDPTNAPAKSPAPARN